MGSQAYIMLGTTCFLLFMFYFSSRFSCRQLETEGGGDTAVRERLPELPHKPEILSADDLNNYSPGFADLEDDGLSRYIRQRWLIGPSNKNISSMKRLDMSQVGQSTFIDNLLKQKRNGFFVECGAATGIGMSNSVFFETQRGWSGLLVEANPMLFQELLQNHRNSYAINSCLSTTKTISEVQFKPMGLFGRIVENMDDTHMNIARRSNLDDVTVTCFPLYSLLRALSVDHIDYFSLDVEGPELDILETIPFDKITIDVLSIEYRVSDKITINQQASRDKLEAIRRFFTQLGGYREVGIIRWNPDMSTAENEGLGLDVVFKRT